MRIGIPGGNWWKAAGETLQHEVVDLPLAEHADGNAYTADFVARVANGQRMSEILAEQPVNLILDNGATGLAFVDDPAKRDACTPVHEATGLTLCSHLIDPLAVVFQGLAWTPVWHCLHSRTWVKAVWDRAQAEELRQFGIPNVIHLPMAAPDREYNTEPLDPDRCSTAASFVGGQNTAYFRPNTTTATDTQMRGALAHSVRADMPGMTYYGTYHGLYEWAEPIAPDDDLATQTRKTTDYYNSKVFYNALMCLRNRDRFVIFLKRKMGDEFQLIGKNWDQAYGLSARPPFSTTEEYFNHFRKTAVNLNLVNGNAETGLNMRHFEITAAGGFMLCYDQPELAENFEIGKECAVFRNEEELLEQIEYYLGHPQERVEIALAGQRRTLSHHLYSHRLADLLRLLRGADAAPCRAGSETSDLQRVS
ncbi:MAG: glycosyltransferase [Phycisphaerae bacterium]